MSPILGIIASSKLVASGSFESIATVTATGGQTSLTFSSIPSTYKHLQIRFLARSARTNGLPGSEALDIQFNADVSGIYSYHFLRGDGSSVFAGGATGVSEIKMNNAIIASGSSNTLVYGVGVIDINDYSSTAKNKTVAGIAGWDFNNSSPRFALNSGLWPSTSAISSIVLSLGGEQFASGSVFSLYGIKGA